VPPDWPEVGGIRGSVIGPTLDALAEATDCAGWACDGAAETDRRGKPGSVEVAAKLGGPNAHLFFHGDDVDVHGSAPALPLRVLNYRSLFQENQVSH
jgi:hypothetical protein